VDFVRAADAHDEAAVVAYRQRVNDYVHIAVSILSQRPDLEEAVAADAHHTFIATCLRSPDQEFLSAVAAAVDLSLTAALSRQAAPPTSPPAPVPPPPAPPTQQKVDCRLEEQNFRIYSHMLKAALATGDFNEAERAMRGMEHARASCEARTRQQ
jgi:hypothetical protein